MIANIASSCRDADLSRLHRSSPGVKKVVVGVWINVFLKLKRLKLPPVLLIRLNQIPLQASEAAACYGLSASLLNLQRPFLYFIYIKDFSCLYLYVECLRDASIVCIQVFYFKSNDRLGMKM